MTQATDLWNRYQEFFQYYDELGLSIDISRIRFDNSFLDSMAPAAAAALAAMTELEAGAIANPDEQRMVGHYWLRAPAKAPSEEITQQISTSVEAIRTFARRVHQGEIKPPSADKFTELVIVGIGGSALGPQLIADALGRTDDPIRTSFCDNTDPDGIARTIARLTPKLSQTMVVVISKSGGTPEPRNGQLEFAQAFADNGLDFAKHAVAVTCDGSKLDSLAREQQWLERFPLWDWVGGRTSVFCSVGLLPAALQGIDIDGFISGGTVMDEITRIDDPRRNPAMLLALMWHAAGDGKGKKDMVVLPYKDRLVLLSKYLQQLVMESLGKENDLDGKVVNQGIAVYGNKGSTDQHAYVQQLREGVNNFFATFIEVLEDYVPFDRATSNWKSIEVEPGTTSGDYLCGFLQGTRRALYENGRDSITITVRELSPKTLGALIALYDRAVGFYASLVNINAYHQPGVEAGKKAAAEVLEIQQAVVAHLNANPGTAFSADELAQATNLAEQAETIYKILAHLAANNRGISLTGTVHPREARFSAAG